MRFHRPRPLRSRATISVVIPCYNYGHFLGAAVSSALDQEGLDVEVLIVDDASPDGSAEVALELARRDPRVDVLLHEQNRGHIRTYNDGLAKASGDYVVLLSADDALVSGALVRAVSLMQHHPRVGMVYGHSLSFSDTIPRVDGRPRSWTTWRGADWLTSMCGRAKNPVYTPSAVMRREAWKQIDQYDERLPHGGDMLLWLQTAARWDIGRVNNDAQAFYRVHGSNMHLTTFAGMLRDLREQREVVRILFEEPPGGVPLPEHVRVSAHRSLVRRARRLAIAELRASGDNDAADAFDRFADETAAYAPAAAPNGYQRRLDAALESGPAGLARRVERHLEWRLWRRYGL